MWPATLELLVLAAAISAIVAYSAHSGTARHSREVADGKFSSQGEKNSIATIITAAERGTDQPDMAVAQRAAAGQREGASEAFSGHSR